MNKRDSVKLGTALASKTAIRDRKDISNRMRKHARHGRKEPYTEIGILRLPCFRCGDPSRFQWQVCADKCLYRPICETCDIELNKMVLRWMGDPEAERKIEEYKRNI